MLWHDRYRVNGKRERLMRQGLGPEVTVAEFGERFFDKSIVPAIGSKRLFDYAMTAGLTATNPVMALPMRHVHRARSRDRALAPRALGLFAELRSLASSAILGVGIPAGNPPACTSLRSLPARRDRPRSAEPAVHDGLTYAGLPPVVVNG